MSEKHAMAMSKRLTAERKRADAADKEACRQTVLAERYRRRLFAYDRIRTELFLAKALSASLQTAVTQLAERVARIADRFSDDRQP